MLVKYFEEKDVYLPTHMELRDIYYQILSDSGFTGNVYKEIGIYRKGFRFDILTVKRWSREVKGFEVKVSRADFKGDKKWGQYLDYCERFSFIKTLSPTGKELITKEELPAPIGLVDVVVLRRFGHKMAGFYLHEEDAAFLEKEKWSTTNWYYTDKFWRHKYPEMFDGYKLEIVGNHNVYYRYERNSSLISKLGDEQYISLLESVLYRDYFDN